MKVYGAIQASLFPSVEPHWNVNYNTVLVEEVIDLLQ